MIELRNVTKTFEDQGNTIQVLKGLDFSLASGEMVAITGASGSGKSTLLNILSSIMKPDSGSYQYNGKDILKNSNRENCRFRNRYIGYIFQDFALLETDSVYNNIVLPLRYQKEIKRKTWKGLVQAISADVGIEHLLSRKVRKLSGGEKQRVAIARAIIANQALILADEPTGSLDKENTKIIVDLLKNLNAQGRTIILATHDMEVARQCGKIYQLVDGQLIS